MNAFIQLHSDALFASLRKIFCQNKYVFIASLRKTLDPQTYR